MKAEKAQTTLRISPALRDQFKEMVSASGGKLNMSSVMEEAITNWIKANSGARRTGGIQMDQVVRMVANAVAEQLRQNHEWARRALNDAGMGLPGGTVFHHRIGHFADEKQELGNRLAHFLLRRAIDLMANGKHVYLLCDSGTTVYWFLKALGDAISTYCETPRKHMVQFERLTIVSNNLPGCETFMMYASQHDVPVEGGRALISNLVKCRLLAGWLLPEYVALTGKDANLDLGKFCEEARNEVGPSAEFIGVTTGNWITIAQTERDRAGTPHLLARGEGHGEFKAKLLDVSDQVFVLSPLGKVLRQPVDKLNELLGYMDDALDPEQKAYESVEIPSGKSGRIKLVTTSRERRSVLLTHSAMVINAIGEYRPLDPANAPLAKAVSLPITALEHLLFPFDLFAEETMEAQIAIELPHENTRNARFLRDCYDYTVRADF